MSIASEAAKIADRLREPLESRRLADAVRLDRPTLVLGSAPGAELPAGWRDGDPLVTVNASQASAEALGLLRPPALTVLAVATLGSLDANREAQRLLRGRRTTHLVIVADAGEWRRDRPRFEALGYGCEALFRVTPRQRNRVVRAAIGVDAGRGDAERVKVSNGIYAICQALALGAPRVLVAGIAPASTGHAYNALGHGRQHLEPDRRALALLATRGAPVFAASPRAAGQTGLPVWR